MFWNDPYVFHKSKSLPNFACVVLLQIVILYLLLHESFTSIRRNFITQPIPLALEEIRKLPNGQVLGHWVEFLWLMSKHECECNEVVFLPW